MRSRSFSITQLYWRLKVTRRGNYGYYSEGSHRIYINSRCDPSLLYFYSQQSE
jgi:hypothetical protein